MQYLCTKALLGEPQEVTEYTIAVDVFGKAPDFKESKDSSIRVEAHRLRKRLDQYYKKEGANSRVRIVIAPGQYFPEFQILGPAGDGTVTVEPNPAQAETAAAEQSPADEIDVEDPLLLQRVAVTEAGRTAEELPLPQPEPPARRTAFALRMPVWLGLAAGLLLVIVIGAAFWRSGPHTSGAQWQPPQRRPAVYGPPATVPLRIMAGYSGPSHTDPSGNVWVEDRYFEGGRAWVFGNRESFRPWRTNDPWLFRQCRNGEFIYHIPIQPGVYELHLHFMQPKLTDEPDEGENSSFMLHINGALAVPFLDVVSNAMGRNIADELIFRDIRPAVDGRLHLMFQSVSAIPVLSGLELLPGIPNKQLPLRIVAQERPFTDHLGQLWEPDSHYMNGKSIRRDTSVTGSEDPGLFAGERYGHFSYALPADVRGRYTLKLHFAEAYFGPQMPGGGGPGSRVFKVMCNGQTLLDEFDVFREAGSRHALVKTFPHLKPSAQGKLNVVFEPIANYAIISAIELLDES